VCRQPAAASPAPDGVLLAQIRRALLRLGLGAGERGLDLLEGKLQLVLRQPLRARPELHALQLAQQVLQPLVPRRQRVPFGHNAVALRQRGQQHRPQHNGIIGHVRRWIATLAHRRRDYAAAVGV
jgi:hypothetical protein